MGIPGVDAVRRITQEIMKTFQLSEEEKRQLFGFRDALKRLLREAWAQAKEKLMALHKAVAEGTYRLEGNKLHAPDGTWMEVRGAYSTYYDPRRKRLGVFPRLAEASA